MARHGTPSIKHASSDRPGVPLRVQDHLSEWAEGILAQRLRHRLTREELARSLQVSRATIQRLESGDPGIAASVYVNALMTLGLQSAALPALDPIFRTSAPSSERPTQRVRHSRTGGADGAAPADDADGDANDGYF